VSEDSFVDQLIVAPDAVTEDEATLLMTGAALSTVTVIVLDVVLLVAASLATAVKE
jgi:hypothetical protein